LTMLVKVGAGLLVVVADTFFGALEGAIIGSRWGFWPTVAGFFLGGVIGLTIPASVWIWLVRRDKR
jgi:hypothetical protein